MAEVFRVEHADEVAQALVIIAVTAINPQRGLQLAAVEAARLAAANSPVLTGRLRGSWAPLVTRGRALAQSTLPYAGPIDRGWAARNIAPARISERTDRALERVASDAIGDDVDRTIREQGLDR